ncbi:MAG: electron transfer flavoprotein subunit beta/FixA family protein [Bacteroidales bacterium]|nr:electron transfer flavoprotein subunit beta/FixA family protein [Bacteroidales bacterium]MBR5720490.1 electron transfer flavoprotein subunit beta/FixA family protein [Bacteroidales bacterium]MBR6490770.1 electron transfer flavoprotein subunit beta/FixA family protein [Bacteroidales bacterium]
MNIVVCIKQVPDTNEIKINPVTGTLIREGVPSIMNPDDKGGLELALRLKDKYGAHVTVVTMGPMQADAILREAFAMGVDRAILLSDRKFAGADTLATSYALSCTLRQLDYDLVITGRQAIDGDTAQVGPELAEQLGLPQVSYLEDFELGSYSRIGNIIKNIKNVLPINDNSKQEIPINENGKITATLKKQTEDGYEILECELPMLVTVLASSFKPRYMSVSGIVNAYNKEVEVWNVSNINADETRLGLSGSPTRVKESFAKAIKQAGVVHEVEPEEAVDIIINKLKEKFII